VVERAVGGVVGDLLVSVGGVLKEGLGGEDGEVETDLVEDGGVRVAERRVEYAEDEVEGRMLAVAEAEDAFDHVDFEVVEERVGSVGRDQVVEDLLVELVFVVDFDELVCEALVLVGVYKGVVGPF